MKFLFQQHVFIFLSSNLNKGQEQNKLFFPPYSLTMHNQLNFLNSSFSLYIYQPLWERGEGSKRKELQDWKDTKAGRLQGVGVRSQTSGGTTCYKFPGAV